MPRLSADGTKICGKKFNSVGLLTKLFPNELFATFLSFSKLKVDAICEAVRIVRDDASAPPAATPLSLQNLFLGTDEAISDELMDAIIVICRHFEELERALSYKTAKLHDYENTASASSC